MTTSDPEQAEEVTVLLRVTPGSDPISGCLEARGRAERFVGWLHLSALIEGARQEPASESTGGSP